MISDRKKPSGYTPFKRLVFCSNTLIGGGDLITVKDVVPLLIGKGSLPMVWLKVPSDPSGGTFVDLIDGSVAKHPLVRVDATRSGLTFFVAGLKVLHVYKKNEDEAVVDFLDLRNLGYEIYGDDKKLTAGGMRLSGNTMENVGVMLSLG